jgi:hypothetical protein
MSGAVWCYLVLALCCVTLCNAMRAESRERYEGVRPIDGARGQGALVPITEGRS